VIHVAHGAASPLLCVLRKDRIVISQLSVRRQTGTVFLQKGESPMRVLLTIIALSLVLVGCSAGVTRPDGDTRNHDVLLSEPADVTLTLTDSVRKQIGGNLKFDQNHFYEVLKRTFDARGLLAKDGTAAAQHVIIEITDVRVRGTFSAVMWGFLAGNDHLKGRVTLLDADNHPLRYFDVTASYAFGGLAGGQDGMRLDWLYEHFASQTLDELAGAGKAQAGKADGTTGSR
jgi:hypothetical protein